MQTARNTISHATAHKEHAFNRMSVPSVKPRAYVRLEMIRNAEGLLTRDEQHVCDMATD